MHRDISEVLFTEDQITQRVSEMGEQITHDYADAAEAGERIMVLCVLKGAAMFMADLVRRIDLPVEMDYMAVSSYGNGAKSSGIVRIQKDISADAEGAHLILAEDIIDSGLTMNFITRNLLSRNPKSLEVAAFLRKQLPDNQPIADKCKYIGFETPDEFLVGYGLDFADRYRSLPYIGVLKPEVYN